MSAREKQLQQMLIDLISQELDPDKIILFGSRSKGHHAPTADFDLAVSGSQPDITIQQRLSQKVEAAIGLYKADIVYLDDVESDFKEIILSTGKTIYEK